ncbi:MAG: DUF6644 family protein [Caulobacteraceae bacterium]
MADFDPIFRWIEQGAPSTFLRESAVAFPLIVTLHTIGMGFLAGGGAVIDLRLLGLARQVPIAALRRFLPVLWAALAINVASGLLLLTAYPTKALTNPVFYLKMTLLAAAVWCLFAIRSESLSPTSASTPSPLGRRLAGWSLFLWLAAITAGRLLAYTHTRLLVDLKAHF